MKHNIVYEPGDKVKVVRCWGWHSQNRKYGIKNGDILTIKEHYSKEHSGILTMEEHNNIQMNIEEVELYNSTKKKKLKYSDLISLRDNEV